MFSQCFAVFVKFALNFQYFIRKMTLIAYVFRKLQTVKEVVRQISKEHRFRTTFKCKHAKGSQTIVKSASQHFYQSSSSPWVKVPRKIFVIVIGKTLVVFVNTWTSNDKYSVPNSDNLSLSIQLLLFKKRKSFVNFLFRFWNLHQNLNILKKKMIVIAIVFPKLQTGKTCLGHSLRSAISEHLLTINILKGRKHF